MTNKIDKTLQKRGGKYGTFPCNSRITQSLCDVLKTAPNYDQLTCIHLEAYHMIFHKIARSVCGECMYSDNIHDVIGYAKLLEDYLIEEETNAKPS